MATATLISYPSALCLAGNISPVRVSAAGLFTFRLKKGSSVLLEEDYVPDSSGQAEIDIRDIILADLSLSLPDADVYKQVSAVGSYTLTTDTDSKSFRAVLGGIDRPATDAATFLEANFLTWQPQIKSVAYNQPEWLSFYVWSTQTVLKARFYLKGGTTSDIVVAQGADFDPNCIYSVNVQFSRIWSLGTGDRYGMFDVWVEDGSGKVYTYTQRYVLDASGDVRTVLVARNSLGGIDTFSFHGDMERAAEADHTNVMYGDAMLSGLIDLSRTYTVNTGILSGHGRDWVWDLQRSPQAWVLMDGALRGIVMLAPAVTASMYEDSTGTVDFLLCDDSGYLNMPRMESLPEYIEVPGPDGEVFFLAPRLIEYPDASLEDSWLIPLQSGFEEKWYKASLGGIRNYVAGYLEDTYGKLWHGHDNLAVLNKFGIDASGALTWSGNPVGSGVDAGAFVTLATEQTITGKKTFSADAVFATKLYVPSSAGAGVYDVFIDDTGAVSGETPSAGGGLDEDELWSILSAQTSDVNEVIDRTHLPSILVYDDDLAEALEGYVSQTELSTALQPYLTKTEAAEAYATKDSLKDYATKDNLKDYVTLATAQTITGKKTFSADAVFAAKLYVPSSAGAGVYDVCIDDSGAVSGETPSAEGEGLDIDAMWNELAADDASRAIHLSHIPLIPWANVSGKPMTLQGYGLLTEADNRYVRQVTGMGLSSNDYTDGEKEKLSGIAAGAQVNVLESVKLNGYLLQITSKAVNVNAVTSLSVPTGLSAGDMTSAGKISVSLASGYVIPKNTAKFWGRTWNGLADVSGAIEGATDIDASGTVYAATAIRTNKLYVPSTSGNNIYDIFIDDNGAVSGEAPAAGEGLDIDAMWDELATDDASRTIHLSHIPAIPTSRIAGLDTVLAPYATQAWVRQQGYLTSVPKATSSAYGGIKIGYPESGKNYPVELDSSGRAYVSVPWVNTTYSLSSFGITATAEEINKLDGIGTLLHSGNIGSYALTPSNYTSTLDSRYVKKAGDTMTGILELDSAGESIIRYWISGVKKGATGYLTGTGAYLYSWPAGKYLNITDAGTLLFGNSTVWHSGNDGSGSGLDADLLDGYHSSSFFRRVDGEPTNDYSFGYWNGVGSYASFSINAYGGQFKFTTKPYYRYILANNPYSDWNEIAFLTDNVASATKLQTSRTLWGRPFDGTDNVSGDMTGVGSITASGNIITTNGLFRINVTNIDADRGLDAYYSDKRLFCGFGNSGNYGIYTEATGWAMSIHGTHVVITQYSGHNVGIGTTSPAYKLDVAGEIRATSGITIGSMDDYGWYISTGTRISAGIDVARGVNVGSLLVSNAWADYTKVPTNGIYSKGDIWTGGKLYIPSTAGNNVYDIFLDDTGAVPGEVPGIDSLDKITDLDPSWQPVLQEEPALLFAGRVSSTGTVTKYAGTGTLSCTRSATGIYALSLKDDSQSAVSLYNCCVTATALYTSSTSAAYICTTNYVSSVYSVKISNLASGALANCAFNVVIFK